MRIRQRASAGGQHRGAGALRPPGAAVWRPYPNPIPSQSCGRRARLVLSAGVEEAGVEVLADAGEVAARRGAPGAVRTSGPLAAKSGAHGLTYLEYDTGARAAKPRLLTKAGKPRHALFRRRAQGKE